MLWQYHTSFFTNLHLHTYYIKILTLMQSFFKINKKKPKQNTGFCFLNFAPFFYIVYIIKFIQMTWLFATILPISLHFSPQCNWIIDMLYVLKTEAKPVGVVGGSPWQRAPVWSKLCWRLATDRYENDGCWLIWRIASTFLDDLSALCTESRTNLSF